MYEAGHSVINIRHDMIVLPPDIAGKKIGEEKAKMNTEQKKKLI